MAAALAFHGWSSWPSRETLAQFTNLHPNHISRASKELEDAGIISRRRRYHKGGTVGIQYTFNGDALISATADQHHPTLGNAIAQLTPAANTILVSAPAQEEPTPKPANTILGSTPPDQDPNNPANTKLVSAPSQDEVSSAPANTNLVSAAPIPGSREYQIGIRANTNLVPEPEVTEPEGVTVTDELSQSNSGSSGSSPARDKTERPPPWHHELATALDPTQLPDLRAIEEQALLAGWSGAVLQSAAQIYLRNYRNQT